jgi:hypothetical protein
MVVRLRVRHAAGALGMVSLTWAADVTHVIDQTAALTTRP